MSKYNHNNAPKQGDQKQNIKIGSPEVNQKNIATSPEALKKSVNEAVEKVKTADEKKVIEIKSKKDSKESEEKVPLLVKFTNAYKFEGREYNQLDLSGIEDLTTTDLNAIEKMFYGGGNIAPINEMSMAYTSMVAARATKLPIELFENLKANDAVKVKNVISNFLLS